MEVGYVPIVTRQESASQLLGGRERRWCCESAGCASVCGTVEQWRLRNKRRHERWMAVSICLMSHPLLMHWPVRNKSLKQRFQIQQRFQIWLIATLKFRGWGQLKCLRFFKRIVSTSTPLYA